MSYDLYLKAERDINEGLIRRELSLEREGMKPKDQLAKMAEMRDFLRACGDPMQGIPAVHVAGTSGKGSVAAAIAGILAEAGLQVGLHVSPYLQSVTEKIWIADRFISAAELASLVDWVMPIARPRLSDDRAASIHGMASVAIVFEAFRRARVDAMVVEVGCGGRFDLTSFVDTAVSVITNIGLDHLLNLGPQLKDIAWHKAGIARPNTPLITGAEGVSLDPIREEAQKVGAPLIEISRKASALIHNRELAEAAALQMLRFLGIAATPDVIARGLDRVRLAGRSELMPGACPQIILDGAHNIDKLSVAVESALGEAGRSPRIGVVGFLGSKATPELVRPLIGRFDHVIATQPKAYAKAPYPAAETARLTRAAGLDTSCEPDAAAAVDVAIDRAGPKGTVLVTGSFYLVGEVRHRWYRKEDVVRERTSWPEASVFDG